jgi:hypothetical protein
MTFVFLHNGLPPFRMIDRFSNGKKVPNNANGLAALAAPKPGLCAVASIVFHSGGAMTRHRRLCGPKGHGLNPAGYALEHCHHTRKDDVAVDASMAVKGRLIDPTGPEVDEWCLEQQLRASALLDFDDNLEEREYAFCSCSSKSNAIRHQGSVFATKFHIR